ncbi:MAG: tRNA preQ1(34) S-adenosylmethionine ribosyltransferase-isomerase QueA [Victivallales bacterium]|nr:tRNA preQ1(34) S-adenosylmethionine ribosyltransferase-isomerase QueA [Victivallales bacterium]
MRTHDFNYDLPGELIAQYPADSRADARMLVLHKLSGKCEIRRFTDIIDFFGEGDCVVVNDTKVFKGRLLGVKQDGGGRVEILLVSPSGTTQSCLEWDCLMRPGRRLREGSVVRLLPPPAASNAVADDQTLSPNATPAAVVLGKNSDGMFRVALEGADFETIERFFGHTPLPPYIRRPAEKSDEIRYQTVFASRTGSVAAPTAGLHFTPEIIGALKDKGVVMAELTLHVGPGTFQPVSSEEIEDHKMHREQYRLPEDAAVKINNARAANRRVLAVGTTSARVLETCSDMSGKLQPGSGSTDIFIHPPMKPKVADAILTNFHLPRSTLLMLVATFATTEFVLNAYDTAIAGRLRFYSYGDCMLII